MEEIRIGDIVQDSMSHGAHARGKLIRRYTVEYGVIQDSDDSGEYTFEMPQIEKTTKPLSEQDAWLEVALMVGANVQTCGLPLYENEKRSIRHHAYRILGGNKVNVTDEVKTRVRCLIERAERQSQA